MKVFLLLQTLLQGLPVEQLGAASIIQQQPIQQPQQQQQQQQQQPTVNQHLQRQSGLLLQNIRQQSLETPKAAASQATADIPRRASTGSVLKKDGFRVPQQPPASSRVKQRNIAPSHSAPTMTQQPQQQQQPQQPKSSVLQQNTFLAQLLMTGTVEPLSLIYMNRQHDHFHERHSWIFLMLSENSTIGLH